MTCALQLCKERSEDERFAKKLRGTLPSDSVAKKMEVNTGLIMVQCRNTDNALARFCVTTPKHIMDVNLLKPTGHVMHQQFNLLTPSGFFTYHKV